MFKVNNIRILLDISVTLFLLCSSVNFVQARSFLESITDNSKRQIISGWCPFEYFPCITNDDCWPYQQQFNCNCKLKDFVI